MYTRYMKAYVYLWTMSPWGAIFRLTEANQSTSCYNTFTLTWRTASSFLFFHPLTCYHCPPIFLTTIEIVFESLSQLFIRPSLHSLKVLESCLNNNVGMNQMERGFVGPVFNFERLAFLLHVYKEGKTQRDDLSLWTSV